MSVRFDTARCISALRVQLAEAIKKAQKEYLNEIVSGVKQPEARGDWEEGEIEDAAWIIAAAVVGGAWAVMDNYGRGSLMDTSNSALEAYRQSELWNPARPDTYIRGRPPGTYTDIFGRQRISSGRAEGRNLENLEAYAPWPPSKALQVATQVMEQGRFREIIQEAIDSFPWGDFIIATPD
ncbi:MAG: hypothetical protein ACPLTR_02910 [Thermacetogeniaceae bacterium]